MVLDKVLTDELTRRQVANPRYSLRAFSRDLGVSPTTLSLVMSGKRRLSIKGIEKIVASMKLPRKLEKSLISKIMMENETDVFSELELDKLRLVADWYFFAILSLMETDSFQDDPKWISKRLNITRKEARSALHTLEVCGLISQKNGRFIRTKQQFKTPDMVPNTYIQKSHIQALELAKESILTDPVEKRNISAMTMAIDPNLLPEANKMIRNFRRKLCKFLETSDSKTEVYRLSVQLFPISRSLQ